MTVTSVASYWRGSGNGRKMAEVIQKFPESLLKARLHIDNARLSRAYEGGSYGIENRADIQEIQ